MMLLFLISASVTVFLVVAAFILMLGGNEAIDERLMEVAATQPVIVHTLTDEPDSGLAQVAAILTSPFKPIRSLISGSDDELAYRLAQAGFRKPETMEIYTAAKVLLPVIGIIAGTFFGNNLIAAVLVGAIAGFFAPDMVLSKLVSRRQESIRRTLPDALDLLVICMEAGLGIDQAMARVGDEIKLTSVDLAEELQIINREQRAGRPRLDAWRSMAERVDLDFVRQFVAMLVQTERFGTPISQALGQFADNLRTRRMQAAEEAAAKTGSKLLFPLIIFIMPCVFVVSVGPAILNLIKMMSDLNK
jgi:tight adherence protein C